MGRRLGLGLFGLSLLALGCAAGDPPETTSSAGSVEDGGEGTDGTRGTTTACAAVTCNSDASCSEGGSDGPVCVCNQGYAGDGSICTDVDECAAGTAVCDPNATCRNTVGSYSCSCDPGFTGNGKTCTDIDECQTGAAKCSSSTECKNIDGGYKCVCPSGYLLKDAGCADIDECSLPGLNNCDALAKCTNTPGSFTCACPTGYAGDGTTCTEVDECTPPGVNNCDPNATCTNSPGSYTCRCNDGYAGNGLTCTEVGMGTPGEVSINASDAVTTTTAVTLYLQEPANLLQNPGAETGDMSGWQLLQSGGSGWSAGTGDPEIRLFGARHFMSSYALCRRSQLLDLTTLGFGQAQLDLAPPITVREWYQGGGYNPADSYYLKVELRDAANNVLASYALGTQSSPVATNNTWQLATQTLNAYGPGLRYVYFEDGGRDRENWGGYYGAAMDGASVVVGGGLQMRVSNDNMSWSAWQAFAPSLPWTLDAVPGMKVVYVQFKDANNQIWPAVSDTITLQ